MAFTYMHVLDVIYTIDYIIFRMNYYIKSHHCV